MFAFGYEHSSNWFGFMSTNVRRFIARGLLAAVLPIIIAGCTDRQRSIPSGSYVSETTDERIIATDSQLALDLTIVTEHGTERMTKICDYNLHPDSEIWTSGYTSWEYVEVYGNFKWFWDGNAIIRRWNPPMYLKRAHGPTETTRFVRRS
jgi:hypothetical protein